MILVKKTVIITLFKFTSSFFEFDFSANNFLNKFVSINAAITLIVTPKILNNIEKIVIKVLITVKESSTVDFSPK